MLSGIVYCSGEDEAIAVNNDIAFDSLDLFICVETVVAVTVAPFYALGIQCSDCRVAVLLAFASDPHDCLFYEMFDMAVLSPLTEKLIHRLPLRKILGKHYPLAAADQKIQDCLESGTQRIFVMSAIIFKECFVYIRPLTFGQMCLIEESYMRDKNSFRLTTLWLSVFRISNV